MDLLVKRIENKTTYPFLLKVHYLHRIPPIMYSFGLFDRRNLIGVCTFGPSASPMPARSISKKWEKNVIELNRIVLIQNKKNFASFFISRCLKALPSDTVVLSYADENNGHVGIIYQACNFIYCGKGKDSSFKKIIGFEERHNKRFTDKKDGWARYLKINEMPKNMVVIQKHYGKHRYIFFVGSKKRKREFLADLNWPVEPYPKIKYTQYDTPKNISYQGFLF